jgi:DNA-binding LacI/PurR family transcriptional regulator
MRQVSIKDIARVARVSHPTVSRALRNSSLVNPETAERIRLIAGEMGYRANAVARGLVTRKTMTIGVVVTTIADPFIGEVVSGIEELANDRGYSVILANCNADPAREVRIVRAFQERRVDGILVTASRVGSLYIPMLSQSKVPIVLINNQHEGEFVYSVMIDSVTASLMAVQYLISLGHQHIAYIGDRNGFQADTERFEGYRQALASANIAFHPEWLVQGDGRPEGGRLAVEKLLSLAAPPTAIFCYNDLSAIGALSGLRAHGLQVPQDISIIGFDDLAIASYVDPPLTTIRQPKQLMGRMAMEILLDLFEKSPRQTNLKVRGELVVRGSTAPPSGFQCGLRPQNEEKPAVCQMLQSPRDRSL